MASLLVPHAIPFTFHVKAPTMTKLAPITSIDALRQHYGVPGHAAMNKETPRINDAYRQLLEAAPFFTLASVGPDGLDCSPRGDTEGLIKILDAQTIAIPDRRGNNRLDTLENIVRDGRVALLFLIPGCDEALRINGTAIITADPDLLAQLAKQDRVPASAIIVTIQTMYFQCARAIRRAGLWAPESHCDRDALPSAGDLLRSVDPDFDGEVYDKDLQERQKQTMY